MLGSLARVRLGIRYSSAPRRLSWAPSLADARSICLVLLRAEPSRCGRAAVRFHARLVQDVARLEIEDAQIVLAALQGLRGPYAAGAGAALAELFAALELADLQQRLEAWLRVSQAP
jgi:hypothetical protein